MQSIMLQQPEGLQGSLFGQLSLFSVTCSTYWLNKRKNFLLKMIMVQRTLDLVVFLHVVMEYLDSFSHQNDTNRTRNVFLLSLMSVLQNILLLIISCLVQPNKICPFIYSLTDKKRY